MYGISGNPVYSYIHTYNIGRIKNVCLVKDIEIFRRTKIRMIFEHSLY